ncbi:MAG: glucoamylase family protein [Solirubrobacteraceae bacterium]
MGSDQVRLRRGGVLCALLLALCCAAAPAARAQDLERYAEGTWASMAAMTDEESGLPTDLMTADGTREVQTSITNIGAYLWSTVGAEQAGIISHAEAVTRLRQTLTTLEGMERHTSGQFYNWYDHRTGEKLTVWPPTGAHEEPRLSSVDNGWLAVGLKVAATSVPEVSARAQALFDSMHWGLYYNPARNQIYFHIEPGTGNQPCCYDTIVSESRISSYIGIAQGEIPAQQYFGPYRSFPDTCDWSWTETRPVGYTRTYYGRPTYDGALQYAGMRVTPSWGGSMFEALMPSLFLPEEEWAPGSWGANHPLTVAAQIHHGMEEADYGYWGFSPSANPDGGYSVYGVDGIGSDPNGYPSSYPPTLIDHGWPGCPGRPALPDPPPSAYSGGVVTPHAAFLALQYDRDEALANLGRLARDFPGFYGELGFQDAVNVDTGATSGSYLSLDQGMAMAAAVNALTGGALRDAFATPDMARALRPVIGVEEFNSDPRQCTITGTAGRDKLRGTEGDDVICGLGGNDTIQGRGGDDVLFGDAGDDTLIGHDGDDTVYGGEGDDTLGGQRGWDVLSAGPGDDALDGGGGPDHHEGGDGSNTCALGAGDTENACG